LFPKICVFQLPKKIVKNKLDHLQEYFIIHSKKIKIWLSSRVPNN
jgi:hypothetical protein